MKCYVCKFANAATEAKRHPNSYTIFVVSLLMKRLRRYTQDKSPNKPQRICKEHRTPGPLTEVMTTADRNFDLAVQTARW